MRTFREFISEKSNVDDQLEKLIGLLWDRYKPELRDFLDRMGAKDADIRQLVMNLEHQPEAQESDGIYKNSADDNHGSELDNGEN